MFRLLLFTELHLLHTKSNPERKPTEPQHTAVRSNDCSNGLYEMMTETSFQVLREFVYFGLRRSAMTREGFTRTELISPSLSLSLSLSLSSSASSDSLFKKCNYSKRKQSQLLWQQNALELSWGHLLTWEWQNTAFGRIKCRIRPFSLISHEYLRSDLHFRHSVPFHSEITFDQDVLFHCQSLLKDFTSLIAALVMCDRARFALICFFLLLLDGARK